MASLWPQLASLPLEIEDYALERLERQVSTGFLRVSTHLRLRGGGAEGVGEDVSYEAGDHDALHEAGPTLPLAGSWTLESFCDHLGTLSLWPRPTPHPASELYRVWAYESAALDLALRQAGLPLHEALGRTVAPLTFVVSLNLGETPTFAPVARRLERYPSLRFKLDAAPNWTDALIEALMDTGAVDSIDFKGHYAGTVVDVAPDADLYERIIAAFPDAWYEDPHDDEAITPIIARVAGQVTWDAPIHSVADIEARPFFPPRMVNVKPSRLGGLRPLLEAYAFCEEHGIGMYGGGQFELGVGRDHIQLLAAIFHPGTPNDVSPTGFHVDDPPAGLPASPLALEAAPTGFGLA